MKLTQYRFGMNYTPTRNWWYCWNDFHSDDVARDLDAIAGLGADHIRIMLIWPYFQPDPQVVSMAHLDRLDTLMTLANERELDVCAALFVGWLSGYAFKPPYQSDAMFYDLSEDQLYQEHYVKSVAEVMNRHTNVLGFDLGNELPCCWRSEDTNAGDRWNRHMLSLAEKALPQGIHVNGVDHSPWFCQNTFSPRCLAETQKIIPLHCWTFFTGALNFANGDCFDPRCVRLLEAMAAMARSYASDVHKPVWIQEYGMSEQWTDPKNISRFLFESTVNAAQFGVNWFTWWSSHDLDRRYKFDPLEYSLGLITNDQKIKPQGEVFKRLAEEYGGRDVPQMKKTDLPAPPDILNTDSTWQWLENWIRSSDGTEQGDSGVTGKPCR